MSRGKTSFFPGVKQSLCGPRRPHESTSGNLHMTSVREKSKGVYSPIECCAA